MNKQSLVTLLAALMISSCSHQPQVAGERVPASLDGVLEDWNKDLYIQVGIPRQLSVDDLYKEFERARDSEGFVVKLEQLGLARKFSNQNQYLELVDKLFAVKKKIRLSGGKTLKARESSYYLTLLAEDVLFATYKRFGLKVFTKNFSNKHQECLGRVSAIRGIPVCVADILVSKGAAGSSSFLARFMKDPGHFSHSTIAWIDNNKVIHLPEAEIEDGVKLRVAKTYYDGLGMAKFFIYRYTNKSSIAVSDFHRKANTATDKFVADMKGRVKNPATEASYDYDFAMDTNETNKALFCSEVPYVVLKDSGIAEASQAYPKSLWSKVSHEGIEFTEKVLDIKENAIPSPSDIELNANYDMIAIIYDLQKMSNERYDVAMVDAFLKFIRSDAPGAKKFYNWIDSIPNVKVDKLVEYLSKSSYFTPDQIKKIASKVPANIGIKQFVFFGIVNEQVTPKVRVDLAKADAIYTRSKGHPMGRVELEEEAGKILASYFNSK